MRIALFTETFIPKVDGIVTTLCQTVRQLRLLGHEGLQNRAIVRLRPDFTAARKKVAPTDNDPYQAACDKAITVMERDEIKGADPADVARVVEKVLKSTNPPRRVSVGKFDERMGIMGKRLLPFRLFEKAAKSSLGV